MPDGIDVLVLVALQMEFEAARKVMTAGFQGAWGVETWSDGDGRDAAAYILGDYVADRGQTLSIALARPVRMGLTTTAAVASALAERLKPSCLAMCGVCAGNPADVALGDVVVAEMAYTYDEGKRTREGFEGDYRQYSILESWQRAAQELTAAGLPSYGPASQEDAEFWLLERLYNEDDPRKHPARPRYFPEGSWKSTVQSLEANNLVQRQGASLLLTSAGRDAVDQSLVYNLDPPAKLPFTIHVGPMASGNVVVKDGVTWADLKKAGVRSVIGLEMEAAAIGGVARSAGISQWIVIKGVMDHADPKKNDRYKPFAARASAEVLMRFLLKQGPLSGSTKAAAGTSQAVGSSLKPAWRPRSLGDQIYDGEIPTQSLTVKRITDPEDDDLFAIWDLQGREFADEIADNYDDMKRWITEFKDNYARDGDGKFDDIMLALKLQDEVIGYLFAQHYVNRQTIFISYLGYNENIHEARYGKGPTELLKKLIEICQQSPRWKAIVAEVEQSKRGRNNYSRDLFVKFRRYERGLQELLDTAGKLFILDFNYIQPAAKPTDIEKSPTDAQTQRLLFFARDVDSLSKAPTGKYLLAGNEAVKLFDVVISCVYGDAYRDDEEYQKYLRDILASYRPQLECGVSLTDK